MYNKKNFFEIIIGFFIIICSGVFLTIAYKNTIVVAKNDYYTLNAMFERVDGINIGSEVNVSGISVGKVVDKKIDLQNYNAILKMNIENNLKLPVDTSAEIASSNLLGDKYVLLVPGADSEYLQDGDAIEFTQSSINIEGLISKFAFGMEKKDSNAKSE